jgi:hypothetical protein
MIRQKNPRLKNQGVVRRPNHYCLVEECKVEKIMLLIEIITKIIWIKINGLVIPVMAF